MPLYSVTLSGAGHVFQLYRGRLLYRAEETYERASQEPRSDGTVITLTQHAALQVVLRTTDFRWDGRRCPCECRVHGKPLTGCACPCPRHPQSTGYKPGVRRSA